MAVQLVPLLTDKNAPPPRVEMNRFVPFLTKDETFAVIPALIENQLLPLSVDQNTPIPCVPAKRVDPSAYREIT